MARCVSFLQCGNYPLDPGYPLVQQQQQQQRTLIYSPIPSFRFSPPSPLLQYTVPIQCHPLFPHRNPAAILTPPEPLLLLQPPPITLPSSPPSPRYLPSPPLPKSIYIAMEMISPITFSFVGTHSGMVDSDLHRFLFADNSQQPPLWRHGHHPSLHHHTTSYTTMNHHTPSLTYLHMLAACHALSKFPGGGTGYMHAFIQAYRGDKRGNQDDVTLSSNTSKTHRHPFTSVSLFPFQELPSTFCYNHQTPKGPLMFPSSYVAYLVLRAAMRNPVAGFLGQTASGAFINSHRYTVTVPVGRAIRGAIDTAVPSALEHHVASLDTREPPLAPVRFTLATPWRNMFLSTIPGLAQPVTVAFLAPASAQMSYSDDEPNLGRLFALAFMRLTRTRNTLRMRRGVALGVALEPPWTSTSMSADAQQLDAGSTKALQKNKLLRPRFFREEAPSTTILASRPKRCFSIVMTWENSHGRAATDSISPDWVSSSIGLAPTILPFGPMEDGRTMDREVNGPAFCSRRLISGSCWSSKTVFSLTSWCVPAPGQEFSDACRSQPGPCHAMPPPSPPLPFMILPRPFPPWPRERCVRACKCACALPSPLAAWATEPGRPIQAGQPDLTWRGKSGQRLVRVPVTVALFFILSKQKLLQSRSSRRSDPSINRFSVTDFIPGGTHTHTPPTSWILFFEEKGKRQTKHKGACLRNRDSGTTPCDHARRGRQETAPTTTEDHTGESGSFGPSGIAFLSSTAMLEYERFGSAAYRISFSQYPSVGRQKGERGAPCPASTSTKILLPDEAVGEDKTALLKLMLLSRGADHDIDLGVHGMMRRSEPKVCGKLTYGPPGYLT
ncbi:uncharacterized protein CLUP02_12427 [Colletotrichum lupini]|uniref:Uncharacterized protein n=1 Tax=Colletotrichum lupini TaxID=145971 RepID=A0A9Q8T0V9_9PEZI|nr:uncharacterized protein CLUP02_12427 [Colletotrichum lupini]UQC86925.1 hypothetical protein CLUP02_12427 [Colletotrichum lupini]